MQETKLTFLADLKQDSKDSATIDILRQTAGSCVPGPFCWRSGKNIDGGHSIDSSKEIFLLSAIGERAKQRLAENREVLQQVVPSGPSYKDQLGRHAVANFRARRRAHLTSKASTTNGILWQLRLVEVARPEGDGCDLCV